MGRYNPTTRTSVLSATRAPAQRRKDRLVNGEPAEDKGAGEPRRSLKRRAAEGPDRPEGRDRRDPCEALEGEGRGGKRRKPCAAHEAEQEGRGQALHDAEGDPEGDAEREAEGARGGWEQISRRAVEIEHGMLQEWEAVMAGKLQGRVSDPLEELDQLGWPRQLCRGDALRESSEPSLRQLCEPEPRSRGTAGPWPGHPCPQRRGPTVH